MIKTSAQRTVDTKKYSGDARILPLGAVNPWAQDQNWPLPLLDRMILKASQTEPQSHQCDLQRAQHFSDTDHDPTPEAVHSRFVFYAILFQDILIEFTSFSSLKPCQLTYEMAGDFISIPNPQPEESDDRSVFQQSLSGSIHFHRIPRYRAPCHIRPCLFPSTRTSCTHQSKASHSYNWLKTVERSHSLTQAWIIHAFHLLIVPFAGAVLNWLLDSSRFRNPFASNITTMATNVKLKTKE